MLILAETKVNYVSAYAAAALINNSWDILHNLAQAPFSRLLIVWDPLIFSIEPILVHR